MNYVASPFVINPTEHAEVGIWCSMPAAISSDPPVRRVPRVHLHVRTDPNGPKIVDKDLPAIAVLYNEATDLFGSAEMERIDITPPAAFEFVRALENGQELGCINCSTCGCPHLDLGDFARRPHRKHFCGNCGRDTTWSKTEVVSTPLKILSDKFAAPRSYRPSMRTLDIDCYPECKYNIWASTPAIIWTASRPQEQGIHVHLEDAFGNRIVDDTFGTVTLNKRRLDRRELIAVMFDRCLV